MPNPARNMGVNPILGLTTEPLNELIGDSCVYVLSGAAPSRVCVCENLILTPWIGLCSRSRLASYPSMMLRSWMPCRTEIALRGGGWME
jgi:hypothetical protein